MIYRGVYLNRIDRVYLDTLEIIYDELKRTDIIWAVTGSLGFALHGIPVKPHDIDIQTDKRGAYFIGDLFAGFMVERVRFASTAKLRSHFGVLIIKEVRCEIMGDIEKRLNDGTWSAAPDLRQHIRHIKVAKMNIPVLSLQYECDAYMQLGREDKARMLQQWLRQHRDTLIGSSNE